MKDSSLLSPRLDFLMAGGLSIILAALVWLLVPENASTYRVSWIFAYLVFVVNNPHFMASYMLLYWDRRASLGVPKYFWAAVIVPLLLATYFFIAFMTESGLMFGWAVNAMYLTVGWHYVGQIFGAIIVSSARKGFYFSSLERWALKLNLYSIAALSFVNGNLQLRNRDYFGVTYFTWGLDQWILNAVYAAVALTFALLMALSLRKWIRQGFCLPLVGTTAFVAIYAWYIPAMYHPIFWYMIPFFHSFQYLLFVAALKKGQAADQPRGRQLEILGGFTAVCIITALLSFKIFPEWFDGHIWYDHFRLGPSLFVAIFSVFINIHHYFIDNVIWRRDNPDMRYLV